MHFLAVFEFSQVLPPPDTLSIVQTAIIEIMCMYNPGYIHLHVFVFTT